MPPATANRNYAIIVDAGSSGSRSQIYSWDNSISTEAHAAELPNVELGLGRGVSNDSPTGWKVEPGISTLSPSTNVLEVYLRQLIEPALDSLPPSARLSSPVYILATAGMRLLNPERATAIVDSANAALERILSEEHNADRSMRVITGEEEGFFGWLSVNYLMDGFVNKRKSTHQHTWGFLDMGGASTQIAFEPKRGWGDGIPRSKDDGLIDFNLKMTDGTHRAYTVFVATWLGYGTNKARDRHVNHLIRLAEKESEMGLGAVSSSSSSSSSNNNKNNGQQSDPDDASDDDDSLQIPDEASTKLTINDPCLPLNLDITDPHSQHHLHGTGSFGGCLHALEPLLEREAFCAQPPCLFGGQRVPPIDFQLDRFVGVSEYWFSSEHVFGLGGAWDLVRFERAAQEYCSRDWNALETEWQNGGVSGVSGKWGDQVDLPRLRMQCFKASWIVEVLHQGIGIPRIVDPGGNITNSEDPSIKGKEKAEEKGLSEPEPIFQSVNAIDSVPISWTLGSVLLTASGSRSPFIAYQDNSSSSSSYTNGNIFTFTGLNGKLLLAETGGVKVVYVLAALLVLVLVVLYALGYLTRRRKETHHRYSTIPTQMEEGTEAISLNDMTRTRGKTPLSGSGGGVLARTLRQTQLYTRHAAHKLSALIPSMKVLSPARSRTPKLRHSGGVTGSSGGGGVDVDVGAGGVGTPLSQPLQHTNSSPAIMTIKSAPSTPKRGSPRLGVGVGAGMANHSSKSSEDVHMGADNIPQSHNHTTTGLGLFRHTLNPLTRSSSGVNVHEYATHHGHLQPSSSSSQPPVYTSSHPHAGTPPRASLSSRNNSSVNLTTLVSRSTSSAKLNNLGFTKDDDDDR
ncbi:hypothetical protein E3P99_01391 [Wallemia hederae]|uniref:Golgi apyrase n=1 Tax=Wallemia hederae TaxID=1540922 RepID=A0A4T0FV35_9BASI|nr:hypothetical protein E3P99_01391 [Wallemia hederae]